MRVFLTGLTLLAACYGGDGAGGVRADAWSGADALFLGDAQWLGAGDASSVDLGGDRTLWLFGNSFVDPAGSGDRLQATLVANTAGVQTGADPVIADMEFFWGPGPSAFLDTGDATWLWPLHGIRVGGALTLFYQRVEADPSSPLGIATLGTAAFRVIDPDAPPPAWTPSPLALPALPFAGALGAGLARRDGFVFAYVTGEGADHEVYLLRWDEASFAAGSLASPEWRQGGGWVPHAALAGPPDAVFVDGATAFSVAGDLPRGRVVQVQPKGYPAAFEADRLGIRFGGDFEGPWQRMGSFFHPPEAAREGAFVCSTRAHPQLPGADLVVTYTTANRDLAGVRADPDAYYPRFVRLTFVP